MDLFRAHVLVCGGTGCSSSGSAELIERFEEQIAKNGLDREVKVVRTGCFGLCEAGPVVIVYPEGTFYSRIRPDDVDEIVSEHLLKGRVVQHLVYKEKVTYVRVNPDMVPRIVAEHIVNGRPVQEYTIGAAEGE